MFTTGNEVRMKFETSFTAKQMTCWTLLVILKACINLGIFIGLVSLLFLFPLEVKELFTSGVKLYYFMI